MLYKVLNGVKIYTLFIVQCSHLLTHILLATDTDIDSRFSVLSFPHFQFQNDVTQFDHVSVFNVDFMFKDIFANCNLRYFSDFHSFSFTFHIWADL